MRRFTCLVGVMVLLSCNKWDDYFPLPSHPAAPQFNNVYGGTNYDYANSIVASTNGYVFAGVTFSQDGDVSGFHGGIADAWVVKLNKDGTKQWQRALGGSGDEEVWSVAASPDGGCVAAMITTSKDGDVGNHNGIYGVAWIVKLNAEGNIQWKKILGENIADPRSITRSLDGGYVIPASTQGGASVTKLDENGNIVWQKTLPDTTFGFAYSITTALDGGYMLAGDINSSNGLPRDACVVKIDKDGNLVWRKKFSGSNYDIARTVTASLDGGCVVAGSTQSDDGDFSNFQGNTNWVLKLDKEGNRQWLKAIGGSDGFDINPYGGGANAIAKTPDGGYMLTGATSSNKVSGYHGAVDAWVMKLDMYGTILWQRAYGGSSYDIANSIIARWDGSYVMAGTTGSNDGDIPNRHGGYEAWVMTLKDE